MSRRSRSNRPRKARSSEAPAPVPAPDPAKTPDRIAEVPREHGPHVVVDELAALDAGWDDVG